MEEDRTALRGRTALVTGSARRIGRQLALSLAGAGARVAIHYHHSSAEAEVLAAELGAAGTDAVLVKGDLGDPEAPAAIFAELSGQVTE